MTTPADELTTAAAKLRTLAEAASTDPDGTPTAHWNSEDQGHGHSQLWGDYLTRDDGRTISWPTLIRGGSMHRQAYMHTQHADYAAVMGPAVGLALAKWLDSWHGTDFDEHAAMPDDLAHALAIARAINRSQP